MFVVKKMGSVYWTSKWLFRKDDAEILGKKNDDPVRDLPNGVTDALGSYGASGDLPMDRTSVGLIGKSSIHTRKIFPQ